MDSMVERARALAASAHEGQRDRGGRPYIEHPRAVAGFVAQDGREPDDDALCVAWLHDVVEDTPVTLDDLRAQGFSERVVQAVDAISRRMFIDGCANGHADGHPDGKEPDDEYLARVAGNPLACRVKIADTLHNSDITRIPHATAEDRARCDKYLRERRMLMEALPL